MTERFTIRYDVSFGGYKVSIPSFAGGEVVVAAAYDELKKKYEELVQPPSLGYNDGIEAVSLEKACAAAYRELNPTRAWADVSEQSKPGFRLMILAGILAFVKAEKAKLQ
jgi:hypothetical protein